MHNEIERKFLFDGGITALVNIMVNASGVDVEDYYFNEYTRYRWIGDKWIESVVTKESIMNDLPDVAKSGSYNDLVDKPSVKIVMGKEKPENIDEVGLWLNVIDDDLNQ